MNKAWLFSAFFVLFCFLSKAQDQLFKKDNSKLMVEVLEIGPEEIKYKLAENPGGPVYVVKRSDVAMIIYKNGTHELINTNSANSSSKNDDYYRVEDRSYPPMMAPRPAYQMSKEDSLKYYGFSQNFSINFATLMNMEVAGMYQKDFFASHVGIVVPLAVGIGPPSVTQQVYFGSSSQAWYGGNYNRYELKQKLFEVGIGLNYYPNLRSAVNYYVGPVIRYMQYAGQQSYSQYNSGIGGTTYLTQNSTLTRYTFTITNGFIFRTKSRILFNIFGSLGFKNDQLSDMIVDPKTNTKQNPLRNPVGVSFWGGFNLGFSF